jgi:hypothetical protein
LRSKALEPIRQQAQVSQDEFGFDDFDLNDPALNELIGYQADSTALDGKKMQDADFAAFVKAQLSPAVWKLLSAIYMPDIDATRSAPVVGKESQLRAEYVIQVVQCWTACASVMVENRLRVRPSLSLCTLLTLWQDWNSYIVFGDETFKRIPDPLGRREVGMLFGCCLFEIDPEAFSKHCDDFVGIWFESVVARRLTQQHKFTNQLLNSFGRDDALLHGLQTGKAPDSDLYSFTTDSLKASRARLIDGESSMLWLSFF